MPDSEKHVPQRMCVVCRKRFAKAELLRHVGIAGESGYVRDALQRMSGRGIYVCSAASCQEKFEKRRSKAGRKGARA